MKFTTYQDQQSADMMPSLRCYRKEIHEHHTEYHQLNNFLTLNIPSPTWSRTRGSSYPTYKCGKKSLQTCISLKAYLRTGLFRWLYFQVNQEIVHTSITSWSISQMSIVSTESCLAISRSTPPSPPPTTKTCIGVKWVIHRSTRRKMLQLSLNAKFNKKLTAYFHIIWHALTYGQKKIHTFLGDGIEHSARWVTISWYAHSSLSVSWTIPSRTRTFPYVEDCIQNLTCYTLPG
jgi:hypothetical protein